MKKMSEQSEVSTAAATESESDFAESGSYIQYFSAEAPNDEIRLDGRCLCVGECCCLPRRIAQHPPPMDFLGDFSGGATAPHLPSTLVQELFETGLNSSQLNSVPMDRGVPKRRKRDILRCLWRSRGLRCFVRGILREHANFDLL